MNQAIYTFLFAFIVPASAATYSYLRDVDPWHTAVLFITGVIAGAGLLLIEMMSTPKEQP